MHNCINQIMSVMNIVSYSESNIRHTKYNGKIPSIIALYHCLLAFFSLWLLHLFFHQTKSHTNDESIRPYFMFIVLEATQKFRQKLRQMMIPFFVPVTLKIYIKCFCAEFSLSYFQSLALSFLSFFFLSFRRF